MSSLFARTGARVSPKAICALILLMIFGVALSLRVCLPYESIFVGDWVKFGGYDPWYHMRLVENLVQHFPHRIAFDPFTWFPYGQDVFFAPFFDLLLGFVIWVIGLGSPSQHTIETVGAYFPAILGALVTIPVYFIGKEFFNRSVGLLSAGLIAILPGEFLYRSILGFTDHHVAEVLLSAIAALFLIVAIKSAREKEVSFAHIWSRDWKRLGKPLIFALLTGLTLGVYLLSWVGGLLFVFIIAAYIMIQYLSDHLRGKPTDYLCIIGLPSFLIPLVMIAPLAYLPYKGISMVSLVICVLALVVSSGLSRLMAHKKVKRVYYPLVLAGLGLAGLGVFYAIVPSLFSTMLERLSIFMPGAAGRPISETQPFLFPFGIFSLDRAWHYFTTGFFIAFISLGMIIYTMIRERSADRIFIVVWSLIMLAAMLSQTRFAYYYAVNVALLSGYLSWRILEWSGFTKLSVQFKKQKDKLEERKESRKARKAKKRKEPRTPSKRYFSARYLLPAVAALIVFFAVFYPNIGYATGMATHPAPGPNEAWHSSLLWMRGNTPDPFQDTNFYYESYNRPPAGETYDYPESAYGVISWWDYGHWITYIAHRIPNSNPHQKGATKAAWFFTTQDEPSANERLDSLGSKYVIIDFAMSTSKFGTMSIWTGEGESQFFEVYYQRTSETKLEPKILFYPEYYRTMCSRLYNFGGQAVVPDHSTWVISYKERMDERGEQYKEISSTQSFASYEEAEVYLESQTSPNYRIVGTDPFISPVPLEELEHYKLVHQSYIEKELWGSETIPYVQIFEYSP
ncbi:MAG: oligosaccharyl transferase, archaeosortase A system-associated [Dehalococcoidia bacterium]